tara:strand:+ start:71 stop:283 length:213 start_codon:yes stop_codon:yes gene_type:complete
MANIKMIFKGSEDSEFTSNNELECFINTANEITVSIKDDLEHYPTVISLDVSTAIKFAKVLRVNINEIKD